MTLQDTNATNNLDQTQVEIVGASTSTPIGNTGDRLKVDALVGSVPVAPSSNVIYIPEFVRNGSNRSMDVNGSGTAQEFEWVVPASETWYLSALVFMIIDNGSMDRTDFGSISGGIDDGLLIEIRTQGTTYTYANLEDNTDIIHAFPYAQKTPDGVGEEGLGFMDEDDMYHALAKFKVPITLVTGDFVRVTVRDNLTGLDELTLSLEKYRVV